MHLTRSPAFWFLLLFTAPWPLFATAPALDQTLILRTPTTNGREVVFSHGGDLYTVPLAGGVARRLTDGVGFALFPRFSHDGQKLAFTGHYEGNSEVYVMAASGGAAQRLTWSATLARDDFSDRMGPNNIVLGWAPGDGAILYRNRDRTGASFTGRLLAVSPEGGLPDSLKVPHGGFISFSEDGKRFAYNRIFREFRTWKRYRGGMADDIWLYDQESGHLENLTNHPAQDIIPMWWQDRIYFLSERDGRMNLYCLDLPTREVRRITHFEDFDVKFPSLNANLIVFEMGGRLFSMDPETEKVREIPVSILGDRAPRRPRVHTLSRPPRSLEVFPDGGSVLLGERGEVFILPLRPNSAPRPVTRSPEAHDRDPAVAPDGQWISWISDRSGEDAIWVARVGEGEGSARVLFQGDNYLYTPKWSPDSGSIIWADRQQRLRGVEVASGRVFEIDRCRHWEIREYVWSPDGRWVAYTRSEPSGISRIWIHHLESGRSYPVGDPWYDTYDPAFSRCGRYLWFVSNRDFKPLLSSVDFSFAYRDMARVYGVTLRSGTPSPFQPEGEGDPPKAATGSDTVLEVDQEGIGQRVFVLPIAPSEYGSITGLGDRVLFLRKPTWQDDFNPEESQTELVLYDLAKQKERSLGAVRDFRVSQDGSQLFALTGEGWRYGPLPADQGPENPLGAFRKIDFSSIRIPVVPTSEWHQVFWESWRQMRDFLYAPNMHGVDWPAIGKRYATLLPHVANRHDLTWLMGEMMGELSVGHAYVSSGPEAALARTRMGLLGAELARDADSGEFRIIRILEGENWDPRLRSPLTEPGLGVSPGQFLLAIDGLPLRGLANPYSALAGKAGHPVRLRVSPRADGADGREFTVVPIEDESALYYEDWVRRNRARVQEATQGRVGYIHIPDMGLEGLNTFVKRFFPQIRKEALIVDVRANGGGFVSPLIIERLRREAAMIDISRNGTPVVDPNNTLHGPMVCLINEYSASDGDLFPFRFRHHKLGPLIGRRTWGGVVGIRSSLPFVDGGLLHKPEFATYAVDGSEWIIEGVGVYPDLEVDNHPGQEWAGYDQQLEAGISTILELLERHPHPVPPPPPYPEKLR